MAEAIKLCVTVVAYAPESFRRYPTIAVVSMSTPTPHPHLAGMEICFFSSKQRDRPRRCIDLSDDSELMKAVRDADVVST